MQRVELGSMATLTRLERRGPLVKLRQESGLDLLQLLANPEPLLLAMLLKLLLKLLLKQLLDPGFVFRG